MYPQTLKRKYVRLLKKIEVLSAVAVRLTKYTGKSKVAIHPKHLLSENPWYTKSLKKADSVLDLGCGNGQSSIKAAKSAKSVIAVDFDSNLLKIAQQTANLTNTKNVKFKKANLERKLKFNNNSFSKVIFLDVLEHLEKREQILKEIKRILNPNGLLFLGVPNSQTSWKKMQRSVGLTSFSDPDHKIEFSEKEIKGLLAKYKFKIVKISYGKSDTPFRGIYDIIGAFSITAYRRISEDRAKKAQKDHLESSGFEVIAQNIK